MPEVLGILPFWQGFQKVLNPSSRASEGAGPSSSSLEDLGHDFQKGQPFPASGPSGPGRSCRRAEKRTCDFADGSLLPSLIMRRPGFSQATSGKDDRPRTHENSLQGKVDDSTNVHSPSLAIGACSLSFQFFNALAGLPVPSCLCIQPSTSSGRSTPLAESVPLLGVGDWSSVVLHPLSLPPVRRNAAHHILDPPSPPSVSPRPAITRRPSFLDISEDPD